MAAVRMRRAEPENANREAARRRLVVGLGAVWLLDGLLQLQPFMFKKGFVTGVLLPAAAGQPSFLASPMRAVDRFVEPHLVLWNALFAIVQIAIGVGMLYRRSEKLALAVSFAWVLAVWWIGEGLGGIFTGSATLLTGAPGAVLLYGVIGALVWPAPLGAQGPLRPLGRFNMARLAWASVWLLGALLELLPANLAPGAIASDIRSQAAGEPWLLAHIDRAMAELAAGHGMVLSVGFAIVEVAVALGVLFKWHPRAFLVLGGLTALAIWVVGEDLGGIPSGQGTDPNTGPLLLLMALAVWTFATRDLSGSPAMESVNQPTNQQEGGKR